MANNGASIGELFSNDEALLYIAPVADTSSKYLENIFKGELPEDP